MKFYFHGSFFYIINYILLFVMELIMRNVEVAFGAGTKKYTAAKSAAVYFYK